MHNSELQFNYLNKLKDEKVSLSLYLVNGIKLIGYIKEFDENIILLKDSNSNHEQLIYKHAISSIVPSRNSN